MFHSYEDMALRSHKRVVCSDQTTTRVIVTRINRPRHFPISSSLHPRMVDQSADNAVRDVTASTLFARGI